MTAALGKTQLSILLGAVAFVVALAVEYLAPSVAATTLTTLYRLRGVEQPPPEVTIVGIDDASLRASGPWPWPRRTVAELIEKIARQHPKAIGLDVVFAERKNPADDKALADAIGSAGNVVVAAQLVESAGASADESPSFVRQPVSFSQWLMPLPEIAAAARAIGHVHAAPDVDGVLSSIQLSKSSSDGARRWALALEVLRVAEKLQEPPQEIPSALKAGPYVIPILDRHAPPSLDPALVQRANEMRINYAGPPATFPTVSASAVLASKISASELEGKVVLVGATSQSLGDTGQTPFSHFGGLRASGLKMPGVEVHANAYATIRDRKWFRTVQDLPAIALTIVVLILGAVVTLRSTGAMQILGPGLLIAGVPLAGLIFFAWYSVILPIGSLLAGLLVLVPALSLSRALMASHELDRQLARLRQTEQELLPVNTPFTRVPSESRAPLLPKTFDWKLRTVAEVTDHLLDQIAVIDRMLRSVGNGVLLTDAEGRVIFANPAASELLPRPFENLIGEDLESLFGGGKRDRDVTAPAIHAKQSAVFEIETSQSPPRFLEVSISPIESARRRNEIEGIVVVLADITKRKQLDQTKSEMLRLVSHELRTPVSAIQGLSEVLTKFGLPPKDVQEFGSTIHAESGRLLELVNRYLDLSRLESDQHKLELVDLDLAALAEEVVHSHMPAAAQKNVQLVLEEHPSPIPLRGDEGLLKIAFGNLIANAMKYGPARGVVLVTAGIKGRTVEFAVRDQGPGIPASEHERIFEKFYRLRREDDSATHGTGLGLAMVKEIVARHDGSVSVESEEGHGSLFRVSLPLQTSSRVSVS